MCGGVYDRPEEHLVGDLSMEPDVLVRRKRPSELWTDDTDDVAQHRDQNEAAIERKDETSTTRNPN